MLTESEFPVLPGASPIKSDPRFRFVEVPFARELGPNPFKSSLSAFTLVPLIALEPKSGHIHSLPLK